MIVATSLLAGLVFGLGLIVSGMADPAKVVGFLDLAGAWDPSLAFVMGGAIAVGIVAFAMSGERSRSWLGAEMRLPTGRQTDPRLVSGSALFGVGWGIAGFCPGPALAALGAGEAKAIVFVAAMVAGMAFLTYFGAVPLYRAFCEATGYGGTTQRAEAAPGAKEGRVITVRFNADVAPNMPWAFQPEQREVKVRLGEEKLIFYAAWNRASVPVSGTATFNVTPAKAGPYFDKVQCFCFTEQRLEPGQRVEMPVSFFIDPKLAEQRGLDDIATITLSYTFFPTAQEVGERRN